MSDDIIHPHRRPHLDTVPAEFRERSQREHVNSWQAHIDAGRLGKKPRLSKENMRTLVRNELILCGRIY